MPANRAKTGSQRTLQRWVFLLCLAAFMMRGAWASAHLAHESHLGSGLSEARHAQPAHDHGDGHGDDHGDGHDQGAGSDADRASDTTDERPHHEPHAAADHELTLARPPSGGGLASSSAMAALLSDPLSLARPGEMVRSAGDLPTPVPRGVPPGSDRSRAPPRC